MRRRAPQLFAVVAAFSILQAVASGQATMRPTPAPIVTAENESWYLAGEAVLYAGNVYYPTGPIVFFDSHEMVRSGDYRGIPLYSLTTIEPYSKVFVPVGSGLMKPYERRRSGDLAGTAGSTTPSFPIVSPYDPYAEVPPLAGIVRAPAPPVRAEPIFGTYYGVPSAGAHHEPSDPVATTGSSDPGYPLGPLASARKPEGLNGIFIEYRDRRWFSSGPAVELDSARFARVGDHQGFPVYRLEGDETTIYVTVAKGARNLIAPYSVRR